MSVLSCVGRLVELYIVIAFAAAQAGCAGLPPVAVSDLEAEVAETERAFARTMAERDHAAFTTFLADEAVFFSGETTLRGKTAVAAGWRPLFEGPEPPFSWRPDQVEVLESGTLALSTGPVYDVDGRITGRFNSIWRREASGRWRVVFDKGSPVCPPDRSGSVVNPALRPAFPPACGPPMTAESKLSPRAARLFRR